MFRFQAAAIIFQPRFPFWVPGRGHYTPIRPPASAVGPSSQRFRIQGCGVVPSNGIERNWEESRDQSRFGWAFWRVGGGAEGGTKDTDRCGGQGSMSKKWLEDRGRRMLSRSDADADKGARFGVVPAAEKSGGGMRQ